MRIKNSASIQLFRKFLAARQLQAYSELCSIMEDFNNLYLEESEKLNGKSNAEVFPVNHINQILKKYLPLASNHDLSFFTDPEFKAELASFKDFHVESRIRTNLTKYAKHSKTYSTFKRADEKLQQTFEKQEDGRYVMSSESLKSFKKSMIHSTEFTDFYNHFYKHSHIYLGHEHYVIAKQAQENIARIAPKNASNSRILSDSIRPETFDANISGFRAPHKLVDKLSEFEDSEPDELFEDIYTHTLGKKFKAPKGTFEIMLVVGLAFSGIAAVADTTSRNIENFEQTTISTADSKGYDLHLSSETLAELNLAREHLELLKTSTDSQTISNFDKMRNLLDRNMDLIFTDLVSHGVETEHPDWTVTHVDTGYDTSKDTNPYTITFSYIDENDRSHTKKISNFDDNNIFELMLGKKTTISKTFDAEYRLDKRYDDLIYRYKMADSPVERNQVITEILIFFEEIQTLEESMGAKEIKFKDGILSDSFDVVLSDKQEEISDDLDR